ncbi:ABC transporter ATP-binding protein [Kutzneria sp. NPDC051319]|uniref:ABC transporter ATP-binding protein n=1 Tax=Kutzneria sp. NPDC051319 TaxID=3155047 RepID=UPI00341F489A
MKESLRALRFIYSYPLRYRSAMAIATVIMFLGLLGNIAIPLLMRVAINVGVLGGEPKLLLLIAVGVLVAGVVTTALLHLGKRMRFTVASKAVNDLRHDLFGKLTHLGPGETSEASGGRALTRLVSDAVAVRGLTNGGLLELLIQILVTLTMLLAALFIDWRTTVFAVIPMAPVIAVNLIVQLRLQKSFVELKGQFTKMLAGVGESLANINVVKSFGRESAASTKLHKINEEHSARDGQMKRTYSRWEAVLNVVGGLPTPIALWVGGLSVVSGALTVGDLVAVVALIMMFQMSMHMLAMHINGAFRSKVTAQRLLNVMDTADVVRYDGPTRPMPALTGALRAQDVVVEIGSRRVLDGVSVAVAAGESLAIFGPTGSGKSTLLHTLARLRDPRGGVVTYDDIDVREFDPAEIRQHVVCLPQRQWIFEGTLAENIAFARPAATTDEIAAAATAAGLDHIPLTRRFGASTLDLSAGERQRIGLARVLLVDPDILMLDNPTANLDAETEAALLDTIVRVRQGRTLVIATQQLAVSRYVDRVITLGVDQEPDARPLAHAGTTEKGQSGE